MGEGTGWSETFCLPEDYTTNSRTSADDDCAGSYWTPERIALSTRYQWSAYRHALDLARRRRAHTIVDLGCGVATKLVALFGQEFAICGVDQPSAIQQCQRLHSVGTFIAEDFEIPTFEVLDLLDTIDVIICSDVIEHLFDPRSLVEYVRRLAGPETLVIFTTPDRAALHGSQNRRPKNPAHVREWTRDEFRCFLQRAGFVIDAQINMLPFRPRTDRLTLKFATRQLLRRKGLRTNQVVVCRSPDPGR